MFEDVDINRALKESVFITGSLIVSFGALMALSEVYPPLDSFRLTPSQILISATVILNLMFALLVADQL